MGPGGVALEKGFSKGKFPLDGSFSPAFLAVEKRGPVRRDGAKFLQAPLAPTAGPGGAGPYERTPAPPGDASKNAPQTASGAPAYFSSQLLG